MPSAGGPASCRGGGYIQRTDHRESDNTEQALNAAEVFNSILAGKELRAGELRTQTKMHFQIRNDDTFKRLFAQALNEGIIARRQVSEREVYYSLATPKINDEPELF